MTDDLRKLDEEIALARGWTERAGCWAVTYFPSGDDALAAGLEPGTGPYDAAPPYSSSWALAGPLLEEMAAADPFEPRLERDNSTSTWECVQDRASPVEFPPGGYTACEAIARAWLAWRRAQAGKWDADPEPVTPESIRRTGDLLARQDGRKPAVPVDAVKREPKAWPAEHFEGYIPPETEN